jgi:hypothetical protein
MPLPEVFFAVHQASWIRKHRRIKSNPVASATAFCANPSVSSMTVEDFQSKAGRGKPLPLESPYAVMEASWTSAVDTRPASVRAALFIAAVCGLEPDIEMMGSITRMVSAMMRGLT